MPKAGEEFFWLAKLSPALREVFAALPERERGMWEQGLESRQAGERFGAGAGSFGTTASRMWSTACRAALSLEPAAEPGLPGPTGLRALRAILDAASGPRPFSEAVHDALGGAAAQRALAPGGTCSEMGKRRVLNKLREAMAGFDAHAASEDVRRSQAGGAKKAPEPEPPWSGLVKADGLGGRIPQRLGERRERDSARAAAEAAGLVKGSW